MDYIEYYKIYLDAKNDYFQLKNIYQIGGGIHLDSPDIKQDREIDIKFTQYGQNKIPEFKWSNIPKDTVELVLICWSPDSTKDGGKATVHWLVHSIPPVDNKLIIGRYIEATNSFKRVGYDGPRPQDNEIHNYFFTLYALNDKSGFTSSKYTYNDIYNQIKDKILGKDQIVGTYKRQT